MTKKGLALAYSSQCHLTVLKIGMLVCMLLWISLEISCQIPFSWISSDNWTMTRGGCYWSPCLSEERGSWQFCSGIVWHSPFTIRMETLGIGGWLPLPPPDRCLWWEQQPVSSPGGQPWWWTGRPGLTGGDWWQWRDGSADSWPHPAGRGEGQLFGWNYIKLLHASISIFHNLKGLSTKWASWVK